MILQSGFLCSLLCCYLLEFFSEVNCFFSNFRPWFRALVFLLTNSSWKVRQSTQSCIQHLFNGLGESAVELRSSMLTEFSKLLAQQKVNVTGSVSVFQDTLFPWRGLPNKKVMEILKRTPQEVPRSCFVGLA